MQNNQKIANLIDYLLATSRPYNIQADLNRGNFDQEARFYGLTSHEVQKSYFTALKILKRRL
jgi:hypothetical protein